MAKAILQSERRLALFPEDTHRCYAAGYDVGLFTCTIHVRELIFALFSFIFALVHVRTHTHNAHYNLQSYKYY